MLHPKDIKPYLQLLKGTDISELEVEEGQTRIRIARAVSGTNTANSPVIVSHTTAAPAHSEAAKEPAAADEKGYVVTSPFIGTFYRAPSPESPVFVEVGSTVTKGQTLCIVEAMKLMNELECEVNGRIVKIYVENGQPVEYGEKLFLIEET